MGVRWVDLNPDFWVPEKKGVSLAGRILYSFEFQTTNGRAHAVVIQKEDPETGETGEAVAVTAGAMLSRLLEPDMVGKLVRLTYMGERQARSTNRTYKEWRIQVAANDLSPEELGRMVGDVPAEAAAEAAQDATPF